jgi:hypothetical protein
MRMGWVKHVAHIGEMRSTYSILAGKPEERRPLGRPRSRWDNIKMDLWNIGWKGEDWILLIQGRDQ